MRDVITFVIQNETHAHNFGPIMDALVEGGVPRDNIEAVHLDPATGLETAGLIEPGHRSTQLSASAERPFYHMGPLSRLRWMYAFRDKISAHVSRTRLLVVGNDGAVQRRMAQAVRDSGGAVVILLDGLLVPWPGGVRRLGSLAKRTLNRLAARLNLDHYVPSDVCHSPVDRIYVMHENVESILRDQGIGAEIRVVDLPRLERQRAEFDRLRRLAQPSRGNVLYVTGAFKWHGLFTEHDLQQRDLDDICQLAESRPDLRVRVRVHPREDMAEYRNRDWPINVEVGDPQRPPVEDLAWASALVTGRSTMALEAKLLGVPAFIYVANFGSPDPGALLGSDPYFIAIEDLSAIFERDLSTRPSSARQGGTGGARRVAAELMTIYDAAANGAGR